MIKYPLTVFILVLIPTYIHHYGAINFLWFSDIALFLIFFAIWLESSLLMSIALVLSFFMEMMWTIDFFTNMLFDVNIFDLAGYMFDPANSLFLRGLSLFHLLLPVLPVYYLRQWGYHEKALNYAVVLYWGVVLFCFLCTPVDKNINQVHYPTVQNWEVMSSLTWITLWMIFYPLLIMWPKNYIFSKIFKPAQNNNTVIANKVPCPNSYSNH